MQKFTTWYAVKYTKMYDFSYLFQTVMHYFEDVENLSELLFKQLRLIMQRTMNTIRREPTVIVTVLRIIEREER